MMSVEKQREVMRLVHKAMSETEAGDWAGAAHRLSDALWRLTEAPTHEFLQLDAANSSTVVQLADRMQHPEEFLKAIIMHVLLEVPPAVWQGWHRRHMIDWCLAHFCPDVDVLRSLSDDYPEAAINYALKIYTNQQYSKDSFEQLLRSKEESPHVLKGIILDLQGVKPESAEKKAIYEEYLQRAERAGILRPRREKKRKR